MADSPQFSPLDFNPFEGDFGSPGDRTLSDRMMKARKPHACTHCAGPIAVGESYRRRCDIEDDEMMLAKWCALCCAAMVEELNLMHGSDDVDEDDSAEDRFPFEERWKESHQERGVANHG
jgi:hypothetical protein